MEAIQKIVSIDIFLRHFLAGAFFYLAVDVNHQGGWRSGFRSLLADRSASFWTPTEIFGYLFVAALTGIFLHAIQRGSLGILIEYLREYSFTYPWFRRWVFREISLSAMVERMNLLPADQRFSELRTFGSTAHCLYTCAVALWFALILAPPSCLLLTSLLPSLFLVIVGFLTDCRKFLLEERLFSLDDSHQVEP
jgi:hypothetical protein